MIEYSKRLEIAQFVRHSLQLLVQLRLLEKVSFIICFETEFEGKKDATLSKNNPDYVMGVQIVVCLYVVRSI